MNASRIRIPGQCWVGARRYGPEVWAEGAGPEGRDAELLGSEGGYGDVDNAIAAIEVKVGWMG